MKSVQIMKRDFMSALISQRTSDKFFNATELLALYNSQGNPTIKELPDFWKNQGTQAFIKELDLDILNTENSPYSKTYETTRGGGGGTWMHPYLFVKFAMWLSPKFELQIIKWVYDNLIDFRTQAGDYYKDMCQALKEYHERNNIATDALIYSREASVLNKIVFGKPTPKQRNEASEYELALMNDLQLFNIIQLEDNKDAHTRKIALYERAKNFARIAQKKVV
jgi:hypothetical protein